MAYCPNCPAEVGHRLLHTLPSQDQPLCIANKTIGIVFNKRRSLFLRNG